MSSIFQQTSAPYSLRGAGNSCRANAKYACNYGNIRAGTCPGYVVKRRLSKSERARRDDKAKYEMEWVDKRPNKNGPKGSTYFETRQLVNNDAEKLEQWNAMRCLPRDGEGELKSGVRSLTEDDGNFLCKIYENKKGCVASLDKDTGKMVGKYRQGPTRYKRNFTADQMKKRDAGKSYEKKTYSSGKKPAAITASASRKRAKRTGRKKTGVVAEAFEMLREQAEEEEDKPYREMNDTVRNQNWKVFKKTLDDKEYYMYENADVEIREDKDGYRSLHAAKNLRVGSHIAYTGEPISSASYNNMTDERSTYVVSMQHGGTKIDGHPSVGRVNRKPKPFVISKAAFANEPSLGQKPNAELVEWKQDNTWTDWIPALELTRNVKKGEEILLCYGGKYKRNYFTSCDPPSAEELLFGSEATGDELADQIETAASPEVISLMNDYANGIELTPDDLARLNEGLVDFLQFD